MTAPALCVGQRVKYVADGYWSGRTGVVVRVGAGEHPMLVVRDDATGSNRTWPAGCCMPVEVDRIGVGEGK